MSGLSATMTANCLLEVKNCKTCRVFYHEKIRKENYTLVRNILNVQNVTDPVLAPKPFARKVIFSAQAVVPTGENQVSNMNPPRFTYPKECLKHRFLPYGTINTTSTDVVMKDAVPTSSKKAKTSTTSEPPLDAPSQEEGKKKGKKRKGEAEADSTPAPKKSKKSKVSS